AIRTLNPERDPGPSALAHQLKLVLADGKLPRDLCSLVGFENHRTSIFRHLCRAQRILQAHLRDEKALFACIRQPELQRDAHLCSQIGGFFNAVRARYDLASPGTFHTKDQNKKQDQTGLRKENDIFPTDHGKHPFVLIPGTTATTESRMLLTKLLLKLA